MKRAFGLILVLCLVFSCLPSVTVAGVACDHVYATISFEPTCVEKGYTLYLCRLCGNSYISDPVPALGHDLLEAFIATGGCGSESYSWCQRCDYIHSEWNNAHGYTYGACWFCDKGEPNAIYRQIDFPINGEQIVLAYRNYALNTAFEPLRIEPEDGAVSCPPSQMVWTIHREGSGYILCHREQALCIENAQLALGERSDACSWILMPDEEQGGYRFYCEEGGVYLTEGAQGWLVSPTFSKPFTMYAYCDHVLSEPAVAQEATCCQEGLLQRKCLLCEGYYEEAIPTEPHSYENGACIWCKTTASEEHIWSEPTSITEATCTQGAKEYRTCTLCGETTVTVSPDRKNHERKVLYVSEPSCTRAKIEFTGCACGAYITHTYLAFEEHNYSPWVATEDIHASYLIQKSVCQDCGSARSDRQFGLTHDFGIRRIQTRPSCTEGGTLYRCCNICSYTEKDSMEPFGHDLGQWQTLTDPTCAEEGLQCRKCQHCSAEERTALPTVDHTWDQGVVRVEPTWIKDGETVFTCLQCGRTETESIDALGKEPCTGGDACQSHSFTDAPGIDHWAHEGIDFAVQMGLFKGMSETTFAPDQPMTRAMLVTVLWRYTGSPAAGENSFTDVEPGLWYAEAVAWAAEENIVNGVGNQRFDPMGKITREQLATILYRYTQTLGADLPQGEALTAFPDGASVHSWAEEALAWAVGRELIKGVQKNEEIYLAPQGHASRAQVATILLRYCEDLAGT